MKSILLLSAMLGIATAQTPLANLPTCAQNCVTSMLALGPDLGCPAADAACLCQNQDFSNGIRDCSRESCPSSSDADAGIGYGTNYCAGVSSNPGSGSPSMSSSAEAGNTFTTSPDATVVPVVSTVETTLSSSTIVADQTSTTTATEADTTETQTVASSAASSAGASVSEGGAAPAMTMAANALAGMAGLVVVAML